MKDLVKIVEEVREQLENSYFKVAECITDSNILDVFYQFDSIHYVTLYFSYSEKSNKLIVDIEIHLLQEVHSFSDLNIKYLERINKIMENMDIKSIKHHPWYSFLISRFKEISQLNPTSEVYLNVTIGDGVYFLSSILTASTYPSNKVRFQVSEDLNSYTSDKVSKKIEQVVSSLDKFLSNDSLILICLIDYIKRIVE